MRTVDLRLVSPGLLQPPNPGAPVPRFTFSPGNPPILTNVVFDASQTTDDGELCGAVCTYSWDFGDGERGSGVFATHQFKTPGTFQVRLTVTDTRGASGTIALPVVVGGGTAPSAVFVFSPTSPNVGQQIFFTAEASRAAPGRTIVSYDWNFGSGRTATGITTNKAYETAGNYVVTLTVTDDAGLQGTVSQTVTVGDPQVTPEIPLVARLVVTPTVGTTATTFYFDASGSRGPANVIEYRYRFGDGSPDFVTTQSFATKVYASPGSYVITLTVRDGTGRSAFTSTSVTVQ
jgi:PKD repeat protein